MPSSPHAVKVVVVGGTRLCRSLSRALSDSGFEVIECGSRGEALAAVERDPPDVCVVDRETGGGWLVATAALASPAVRPKVLVVGGGAGRAERRAADLAGAAGYLPGAPKPEHVVAAVVALVETGSRNANGGMDR